MDSPKQEKIKFLNQDSILPLFVWPKDGELFSSWLYRLAHANNYTTHLFCLNFLDENYSLRRDLDRLLSRNSIFKLIELVPLNFNNIEQLTLRYYEGILLPNNTTASTKKWILPMGRHSIRNFKCFIQYCPYCNKTYFEKVNRIILIGICTDCDSYLISHCTNCNAVIDFNRTDIGKKQITFDVTILTCYNCMKSIGNGIKKVAPDYLIKQNLIWKNLINQNIRLENSILYFNIVYDIASILMKLSEEHFIKLNELLKIENCFSSFSEKNIYNLRSEERVYLFYVVSKFLPIN